jgi:hypothetical protein
MRIDLAGGSKALLGYCANVHPGESFADVLGMARGFAGPVRRALGADALGMGLWISRRALDEIGNERVGELRDVLDEQGLFAFTLNGFPYGNFQAEVVKRAVYHPDLGTPERERYLLGLAGLLARLLPPDVREGTISTLPLGHRAEASADLRERALARLCSIAEQLARLHDRTGKSVRVCLEPEPGCLLETTASAIEFFTRDLPEAARLSQTPIELVERHLGLCFDTCHQAVAFEDAVEALHALRAAGVAIGKLQLSSALVIEKPAAAAALLSSFHEPRFLHQARARLDDGRLAEADDLDQTALLPADREWRVHFHVPIHRAAVGEIRTTREFLERALAETRGWQQPPHFEVETYTWSVLPEAERPRDAAGLARGIADELRWAREQLT